MAQLQTLNISAKRYIHFSFANNRLLAIENNLGRFTSVDAQDLKAQFPFLNNEQKKLAQYVLDMFPENEEIPSYLEVERKNNKDEPEPEKGWTPICNLIGKKNIGTYSDGSDKVINGEATVGDRSTRCFGRCGAGCIPYYMGTYTQECFNHDLCHRITGENWGICKDEFMTASDGYMHAPRCK